MNSKKKKKLYLNTLTNKSLIGVIIPIKCKNSNSHFLDKKCQFSHNIIYICKNFQNEIYIQIFTSYFLPL